jgi:hypothetical protein
MIPVKGETGKARGTIEESEGFNLHKADYERISEVLESIDLGRSLMGESVEKMWEMRKMRNE